MPITVQHTQESLCLAHIYALGGVAGVNYAIRKVYDYGVDGQFNTVLERRGRKVDSGFPLDFQAKATINWELRNGSIVYDLEAKTYNDIVSRTPAETTLILILLCLPRDPAMWHVAEEQATTLRHCCYWHAFTGELTDNENTKRIEVPVGNLLTPAVLTDLLARERLRRQSQAT
jgi:Domain of unknown function (DUF4365)